MIPGTGQIIKSRSVVFEEGFGHRIFMAKGEYFTDDEGNIDSNYDFLTEDSVIKAPQTSTETPAKTIKTDTSEMVKETQVIEKPKVSRLRIIYPPASRKSACLQAATGNTVDDMTIPIINQDPDQEEN